MWDSTFKSSLYENNNMDKKISAFIESKAEIQELLASQSDKKRKLFDVKMSQLLGIFLSNVKVLTSTNCWIQTEIK